MTTFVVTVAALLVLVCIGLMLRWQVAAGALPHFALRDLFGKSPDESVDRKRRQFLMSIVPVVIWGWVLALVLD